jgi:hypothetical protein
MAKQAAVGVNDLLVATLRAVLLDFPLVTVKRGFGMAEKRTVTEAAWKGYDTSILLGRTSIDRLYQNGLLGALLGRSVHALLRAQRLNNAVTGAFFAVLWRMTDVATATELDALREEVRTLAAAIAAQGEKIDALAVRSPVRSKPRVAPKSAVPAAAA